VKLPKVILFDWDNTLVDTAPLVLQSLNHTFTQLGLPVWSEEEARERGQHSGREAFPTLFGEQWQKAQYIFYEYYDTHQRCWNEFV
jgi:phosphoglycolate phosphatase